MAAQQQDRITLGKVVGLHGVSGWVKVFSHTDPKENIFTYKPWLVKFKGEWREMLVTAHRVQGKGLVAKIESFNDRDAARELIGSEIAVLRSQMPKAGQGEYYWADLVGLEVVTTDGVSLGRVDHLIATGANDVLAVKGEGRQRLVPFVTGLYVTEVDLDGGLIRVDWDPEF